MKSPPESAPQDARIYGPQRITAVVETLSECGVAPATTLQGSGVAESDLRSPTALISYEQLTAVFRNAAHLSTHPAAAFRAGARMGVSAYGIYGYGLMSSLDYAELVDFSLKYHRVMGPVAGPVAHVRDGQIATHTYQVLVSSDPEDPLYRFALEFTFAANWRLGRDLHGPLFRFAGLGVRYAQPEPERVALYRTLTDGPLRFGERINTMQVGPPWIDLPARLPDAITHAIAIEICQKMLDELPQTGGMSTAVRRVLLERMPQRFSTLESMAQELGMHPRTLRRRLGAEGASYRDLLGSVRKALALEYLRDTRMSTEDIALRLGYSDAANFRHAFFRWTGRSPQDYRQR